MRSSDSQEVTTDRVPESEHERGVISIWQDWHNHNQGSRGLVRIQYALYKQNLVMSDKDVFTSVKQSQSPNGEML